MNIRNFLTPLTIRASLFLLLFLLLSGLIGSWIIGTKLLFGFYFFLYGNLGKLVIFSFILFVLVTRETIFQLQPEAYKKKNVLWFFAALGLLLLFYFCKEQLLTQQTFSSNIPLSLFTHLLIISLPLPLLLGVFGYSFLKKFVLTYKKYLLRCATISLVLFLAIFQVWKLWPYLSSFVLQAEYILFSRLYDTVYIIPPHGLFVEKFAVEIGEACSGLESIFLFTVLYIFIAVLDWKKLRKDRVILLFPILLLLLTFINILRVFLLILVGLLINPHIMATLFHTYLGLILFVIFFLLFMKYLYGWMRR